MSNSNKSVSPYWAGFRSLWIIVAVILFLLLLILWLMGYGPNGSKCVVPPTVVEKIVEKPVTVEKIVEKIVNVEKLVTAPDTLAPRLGIKGSPIVRIIAGENYSEAGIIAVDNIDTNVDVEVTGKVDANTPGEYVLTYTATDTAGNKSSETRTVIVEAAPTTVAVTKTETDNTPPKLTLNGSSLLKHKFGSSFVDPGALAVDAVDGVSKVIVTGEVDANTSGTYILTYTSTDSAGNTSTEKRKVIIEAPLVAKLYFGLGSAEFPIDTNSSLPNVIEYLRTHSSAKVLVSGYHDPSGNIKRNQQLAKDRALSVRELLQQSGIPVDRIEIDKPAVSTGTGSPEEARRVEVKVVN